MIYIMLPIRLLYFTSLIGLGYSKSFIIEKNFTAPEIKSDNLLAAAMLRAVISYNFKPSYKNLVAYSAKKAGSRLVVNAGKRIIKTSKKIGSKLKKAAKSTSKTVKKGGKKLKSGIQNKVKKMHKMSKFRKLFSNAKMAFVKFKMPSFLNFSKFLLNSVKKMISFIISICTFSISILVIIYKCLCRKSCCKKSRHKKSPIYMFLNNI